MNTNQKERGEEGKREREREKQGRNNDSSDQTSNHLQGCSGIILTRNFTIFTVYATIFGQFMADFHCF